MFGITPFDQMACRKTFHGLRYEGPDDAAHPSRERCFIPARAAA